MKTPEQLFVLPFDHRSYFLKKIGIIDREPTDSDKSLVTDLKHIVYEGFQKALTLGIPKEFAAILVDDIYGTDILKDAKSKGIIVIQTTEISGKDYFEFEHGEDAEKFLTNIAPNYAKALVRFDPRKKTTDEQTSLINLKKLNDVCLKNNIGFLIEPLVMPTDADITACGDKHGFDEQLRADLTIQMITLMHDFGIDPDIWKIEGFIHPENYQKISDHLQIIKPSAKIIILGRGETDDYVEKWINAGKNISGVIGFAVGRTIFDTALDKYRAGSFSKDQAVDTIAQNFFKYYQLFTN